jgi:alkanesulfonate monooxygenase SsuD/methylene tetrahydromethanopterin reductase-like flavin-dependent oxidoreductase (luciferase family)
VCESDAQAAELHEQLLATERERLRRTFADVFARVMKAAGQEMMAPGVEQTGAMDAASVVDTTAPKGPDPFEMLQVSMEDEFIFGSPATVVERIVEQLRFIGAGNLMAYHSPSLEEDELDGHYRRFAGILPALQAADLGEPATG